MNVAAARASVVSRPNLGSPNFTKLWTAVAFQTWSTWTWQCGTCETETTSQPHQSLLTAGVLAGAGPAGRARSPVAALAALGRAPLVAALEGAGRAAAAGDGADHEARSAVAALSLAVGRGGGGDSAESEGDEGEDGDHGNER